MKTKLCFFSLLVGLALPMSASAAQFCRMVSAGQYGLGAYTLSPDSLAIDGAMIWLANRGEGGGVYVYDEFCPCWTPHTPDPNPGEGMIFQMASYPSNTMVCFHEPTNAPVLPLNLGPRTWNIVSCQSNVVATFEAIVGRAPINGTLLFKFNPGGYPFHYDTNGPAAPDYSRFTFTNGAWSPAVPTTDIGEAVWIYQSGTFVYQPQALIARISAGKFNFDVETVYGTRLTVEYADTATPSSWQVLTSFVGDGYRRTVVDESGTDAAPQRFYRVKAGQ